MKPCIREHRADRSSSGKISILARDVWPSGINRSFVQEMCRSLCVTGGCGRSASAMTCGTVRPPELSVRVHMAKLSNRQTAAAACSATRQHQLRPCLRGGLITQGGGGGGGGWRAFRCVCEVQVSLSFIGKFRFDMLQASVLHRAATTQTKLSLAPIRLQPLFSVKSSAKCYQTLMSVQQA